MGRPYTRSNLVLVHKYHPLYRCTCNSYFIKKLEGTARYKIKHTFFDQNHSKADGPSILENIEIQQFH